MKSNDDWMVRLNNLESYIKRIADALDRLAPPPEESREPNTARKPGRPARRGQANSD